MQKQNRIKLQSGVQNEGLYSAIKWWLFARNLQVCAYTQNVSGHSHINNLR